MGGYFQTVKKSMAIWPNHHSHAFRRQRDLWNQTPCRRDIGFCLPMFGVLPNWVNSSKSLLWDHGFFVVRSCEKKEILTGVFTHATPERSRKSLPGEEEISSLRQKLINERAQKDHLEVLQWKEQFLAQKKHLTIWCVCFIWFLFMFDASCFLSSFFWDDLLKTQSFVLSMLQKCMSGRVFFNASPQEFD